jgi:HSP20 family protein
MNMLTPWKRPQSPQTQSTPASTTPVTQLRSNWDRLFDNFLDDFWGMPVNGAQYAPALDILETENELILQVEIPGIDAKDVEINLAGDVLTIAGEKVSQSSEQRSRYHHTERRYGSFQRVVRLPLPVEPQEVQAEAKNGLLVITLRKAESQRPKKISVKGA